MRRISRRDSEKLIARFCEIAHIESDTIKDNTRRDRLPFFRYIFCYCIRKELTWLTLAEIGRMINKDHSTVYAGIKSVKEILSLPKPDGEAIGLIESFQPVCEQYREQRQLRVLKWQRCQSTAKRYLFRYPSCFRFQKNFWRSV